MNAATCREPIPASRSPAHEYLKARESVPITQVFKPNTFYEATLTLGDNPEPVGAPKASVLLTRISATDPDSPAKKSGKLQLLVQQRDSPDNAGLQVSHHSLILDSDILVNQTAVVITYQALGADAGRVTKKIKLTKIARPKE
jgi:hypothetical protein